MNQKKILIFGSGNYGEDLDYYRNFIDSDSILISLNGGSNFLKKLSIYPDILIGDFDSANKNNFNNIKDNNKTIILKYPKDKDYSDFELASNYIIDNYKQTNIMIFGMFGKRTDHFLFNIEICKKLLYAKFNTTMYSINEEIYFTRNIFNLSCNINDIISILPISKKLFIKYTKGLKYQLKDEVLYSQTSRGLSNVAISDLVEINIGRGYAMVIKTKA
jgi:thiamine pyrophosphokinase